MDIVLLIAILVGVALLPFVLFLGIVGLAVLIWSWNRIGRYFINFGRWLGDWRNFVPLSVLGFLSAIFVLIIFPIVGAPSILTVILMVLLVLVTMVIFFFASIAWAAALSGWFWPRWRKLVWSGFVSVWGSLPAQSGEGRRRRPKPPAEAPTQKQPPQKRSGLANLWALMLGKPAKPAKSAASAQPAAANVQAPTEAASARRSWFGTFWALMLGKPQPKKQQARPTRVQTTEQTLGPSGTMAASAGAESRIPDSPTSPTRPASGRKPAKRSWFGSFWALMMGKPSKPGPRGLQPEEVKTRDRADRSSGTAAADTKAGATARVTRATGGEKPAKGGFFAGIWNSIVRGITSVAGLVILAVLWVAQKVREGMEWIRVRLNLD